MAEIDRIAMARGLCWEDNIGKSIIIESYTQENIMPMNHYGIGNATVLRKSIEGLKATMRLLADGANDYYRGMEDENPYKPLFENYDELLCEAAEVLEAALDLPEDLEIFEGSNCDQLD